MTPQNGGGKDTKPFPLGLALLLCVNTVLFFGVYCFFVMRLNINWLFWVYYGLLAAASLAYVIVNRGFAEDKLTYASLPAEWTDEKKRAFLSARDERKKRSKWLLTIIFPLCITVFFDIIYLFFGESIANALSTVTEFLGGI